MKIPHIEIGMSSTALAAAVPYPGKAIRISRKGQSGTHQQQQQKYIGKCLLVRLNGSLFLVLVNGPVRKGLEYERNPICNHRRIIFSTHTRTAHSRVVFSVKEENCNLLTRR